MERGGGGARKSKVANLKGFVQPRKSVPVGQNESEVSRYDRRHQESLDG